MGEEPNHTTSTNHSILSGHFHPRIPGLWKKNIQILSYLYRDLKIFVCQQSNFLFRLFPVTSRCNLSANPSPPPPPIIVRMPQVFQAASSYRYSYSRSWPADFSWWGGGVGGGVRGERSKSLWPGECTECRQIIYWPLCPTFCKHIHYHSFNSINS
jgi:hypothetical protein